MKKILIISTGGTFNKIYNPKNGMLEIDTEAKALKELTSKWLCTFEVITMIGKDSLEMTHEDRVSLLKTITQTEYNHIIVVHGTDTMDVTATYLSESKLDKSIIITGAMVPYSIDPVEATANISSAYGYLQVLKKKGVYIAMNGIVTLHHNIKKDREHGKFILH